MRTDPLGTPTPRATTLATTVAPRTASLGVWAEYARAMTAVPVSAVIEMWPDTAGARYTEHARGNLAGPTGP